MKILLALKQNNLIYMTKMTVNRLLLLKNSWNSNNSLHQKILITRLNLRIKLKNKLKNVNY